VGQFWRGSRSHATYKNPSARKLRAQSLPTSHHIPPTTARQSRRHAAAREKGKMLVFHTLPYSSTVLELPVIKKKQNLRHQSPTASLAMNESQIKLQRRLRTVRVVPHPLPMDNLSYFNWATLLHDGIVEHGVSLSPPGAFTPTRLHGWR